MTNDRTNVDLLTVALTGPGASHSKPGKSPTGRSAPVLDANGSPLFVQKLAGWSDKVAPIPLTPGKSSNPVQSSPSDGESESALELPPSDAVNPANNLSTLISDAVAHASDRPDAARLIGAGASVSDSATGLLAETSALVGSDRIGDTVVSPGKTLLTPVIEESKPHSLSSLTTGASVADAARLPSGPALPTPPGVLGSNNLRPSQASDQPIGLNRTDGAGPLSTPGKPGQTTVPQTTAEEPGNKLRAAVPADGAALAKKSVHLSDRAGIAAGSHVVASNVASALGGKASGSMNPPAAVGARSADKSALSGKFGQGAGTTSDRLTGKTMDPRNNARIPLSQPGGKPGLTRASLVPVKQAVVIESAGSKPGETGAPLPMPMIPVSQLPLTAPVVSVAATVASGALDSASFEMPAMDASIDQPEFASQLSERVFLAIRSDTNRARIELTPKELGPIHIDLVVDEQQAVIRFAAANVDTCDAIRASLGELRERLDESGLELLDADVSSQASDSNNNSRKNANGSLIPADLAQAGESDGRAGHLTDELPGGLLTNRTRGPGTVDLFV